MKKKFETTDFVVNVEITKDKYPDGNSDSTSAWYMPPTNTIVLQKENVIAEIEGANRYYGDVGVVKTVEGIIAHELTHAIDFSSWGSWSYKDCDKHEHLATFMEMNVFKYLTLVPEIAKWCIEKLQ